MSISLYLGQSLCDLRNAKSCCNGVDLTCYGCNPNLSSSVSLKQKMARKKNCFSFQCDSQPLIDQSNPVGRDCFCDEGCILMNDCCDDHKIICSEFYLPNTSTGTVIKIMTKFYLLRFYTQKEYNGF